MRRGKTLIRRGAAVLLALFCLLAAAGVRSSAAEEEFSIACAKGITSYIVNTFKVNAPEAGELTVRLRDQYTLYRVLHFSVTAGKNLCDWDGLGFNGERLNRKYYQLEAELTGASGKKWTQEFNVFVEYSSQALIFALPSADELALDAAGDWFLEAKTVLTGTLVIELIPVGSDTPSYVRKKNADGGKILNMTFRSIAGKEFPEPGNYRMRVYEISKPEYAAEFPLRIAANSPEKQAVAVTGDIMPRRGDPDETIWGKMRLPAVVVDRDYTDHQQVYAIPDAGGEVLGTLHGQTQAVSVFELRDGWARIGAWNHEEAAYMEGWVPENKLKVENPQGEYGLLLDKKAQTITVYRNGKPLDTLLVSTGRMEPGELYQETAAGSFLTGLHRVDFSTNGLKYDFVIQYDGGNLLHQIPYAWGEDKRDFSAGQPYLGAKASHACIRIQAEPGDGGLNAYWIWTHLPYHTRLIILDDPEEREKETILATGSMPEYSQNMLADSRMDEEPEEDTGDEIILTFGGDAVLGGRENYWGNPESMMALLAEKGMGYPLSGLRSLFARDDLTAVNLECVLKETKEGEDTNKTWRFRGLPEYAQILPEGSVELVNTANNHTVDYGEAGMASTLAALEGTAEACGNGINAEIRVKGHLIGFGGCRETNYIRNPDVIRRDIEQMRADGCEIVVYQCHWGTEYSETHNKMQEAMARACVRAGADLVIGHHPHVAQGMDVIDGVPVIYSLGNLVFGGTIQLKTYEGLVARAYFRLGETEKTIRLKFYPILTSSRAEEKINDYCPCLAMGEDRIRILRRIQRDTPFAIEEEMKITLP